VVNQLRVPAVEDAKMDPNPTLWKELDDTRLMLVEEQRVNAAQAARLAEMTEAIKTALSYLDDWPHRSPIRIRGVLTAVLPDEELEPSPIMSSAKEA
jgi:hypothetical protein